MLLYDCDGTALPDDGQNDVTDGSVENYPLDWDAPAANGGCACAEAGDTAAP